MVNNYQNKALYISNYYHQKVFVPNINWSEKLVVQGHIIDDIKTASNSRDPWKGSFLSLIPLKNICEEDGKEIANICGQVFNRIVSHDNGIYLIMGDGCKLGIYNNNIFSNGKFSFGDTYRTMDYLRSKGYLVPLMGLSVKEILEYKWAVESK